MKEHAKHIIMILALAIIAHILVINYRHVIQHDEIGYLMIGKNIAIGNGFSFKESVNLHAERFLSHYPHSAVMQTPLYPVFTAVVYFFSGSLILASKLNYIIFGSFIIIPLYFLAFLLYGKRTAVITGILMALLPSWLLSYHFWNAVTEQSYLFFVLTGAALLYHAFAYKKPNIALLASLSFSIAYLSRPEGAVYVAVACFLAVVCKKPKLILRLVIPFGLVLLGYMLFVYRHTGLIYFSAPKINWMHETGAESNIISRIISGVDAYGNVAFFPYFLLIFISLGLFADKWDNKRAFAELFVLCFFLVQFVSTTPFLARTRYLFASLPFLLLWVSHGIQKTEDWFLKQRLPKWTPMTLVLLIFVGISLMQLKFELKNPVEHKKLGYWIKKNTPENVTIMAREFHTIFYGERNGAEMPHDADIEGKADYVVIDEIEWNTVAPLDKRLRKYLEPKDYGFMYPVYKSGPGERRTILYKFRK